MHLKTALEKVCKKKCALKMHLKKCASKNALENKHLKKCTVCASISFIYIRPFLSGYTEAVVPISKIGASSKHQRVQRSPTSFCPCPGLAE